MTELIKIGILYLVFALTAIYATNYYKKIASKIIHGYINILDYCDDRIITKWPIE